MPIREYACDKCDEVIEMFPPDSTPPEHCRCGGVFVAVLFSNTNWQWGDGRRKG